MKKKKIKSRSRVLDFFVICFFLLLSASCVFLFYKEFVASSVRTDKTKIAEVTYKNRIVQRKYNDRVVWERLQLESQLYDADTIRVSANSMAVIHVCDRENTEITLSENSMIQIFSSDDGIFSISVDTGNLEIQTSDSDSDIQLMMNNNSVLNLKAGTHLSTRSSEVGNDFVIYDGNATLINSNGEEILIPKGQTIKQNSQGKTIVLPVTVTSIPVDSKILNFDDKPVYIDYDFALKEEFKNQDIIVDLSLNSSFTSIEKTYESKQGEKLNIPLIAKKVFWRAYPKSFQDAPENIEEQASHGIIDVISVSELSMLSPSQDAQFTYTSSYPLINFSWVEDEYANNYKVEISNNENFSSILLSKDCESTSVNIQTLSEGNYYWRVTPFYSLDTVGYKEQTQVGRFSIKKVPANQTPVLTYPLNDVVIYSQEQNEPLSFVWKSDYENSKYKVIVSKDSNFFTTEFSEETKENKIVKSYNCNTLKDGTYYWKVIRTSTNDGFMYESDVGSFVIQKMEREGARLVYPPENYSVDVRYLHKTQFMWVLPQDNIQDNYSSLFQISQTENFRKIDYEISTEKTEISNIKVDEGNYYWRVGYKNPISGNVEYISPRRINVCGKLKAPQITWPKKDETIILRDDGTIPVSWEKIEDAQYYKVKLINKETEQVISSDVISNSENVSFSVPLVFSSNKKEIPLSVEIQAFSESSELNDIREGEITLSDFIIRKPVQITLVSPSNNKKMTSGNEIVFTWKNGDKTNESQFVLKKLQSNGYYQTVKTVNNPSTQVKVSNLSNGTYEWYVKASYKDGYSTDSNHSKFVVNKVVNLTAPVLSLPASGFVFDNEYLKTNRQIQFSWKEVQGASDYKFELFYKANDGTLKKVYSQEKLKKTKLIITDLTMLDVGEFEWHVTVYNRDDGKVISKESTGTFEINIQLPDKVKTINPGKMYGE